MIQHRNRLAEPMMESPTKAGWRVNEWCADAGISRAFAYKLLTSGALKSVKAGSARIITTSPREYLASLSGSAA